MALNEESHGFPDRRRVQSASRPKLSLEDGRLIATKRESAFFYAKSLLELAVEAAGFTGDVISRSIRGKR